MSKNTGRSTVQRVNGLLQAGQLHLSQVRLKTDFGSSGVSGAAKVSHLTAAGNCAGRDTVYTYWWEQKWVIDQCATQLILSALQTGGGIAGIAAFFPGLSVLGLIAGIYAVGQGVIQYYDQVCGNQGIAIYITWFSIIPWVGCR